MEAYQQRVIEEKKDLDEKLNRLDEFIMLNPNYPILPQDEKDRLIRQLRHMGEYSIVLGERIAAF
jgi:hypothetical protein